MPTPIVIGLDPEREDTAPLIVGAAMARVTGAPLIALAAYHHDPITNAVSYGAVDAELRARALSQLEGLTRGFDADLLVMGGVSPARVLHEAAVRLDAGLMVVGSSAKGPLGRVAPGATSERLLHGAPCPVVIAPAGLAGDWEPRRIGAGYIDLEDGHNAIRTAAALADAAGATLRVRTVLEPLAWMRSSVVSPYSVPGTLEASEEAAQRALDHAIASLPANARVTGEVVAGQPVDALVELSGDVDLLVCGSRGYGPVRSVLLGGVTHPLIRKAQCPVVIVPRGSDNALSQVAARRETTST
jgi:nucleotide-binding universal stress UspA family protein